MLGYSTLQEAKRKQDVLLYPQYLCIVCFIKIFATLCLENDIDRATSTPQLRKGDL